MESAKRMVLVDEKWLDNLYRKHQDSGWRKPTDQTVKSKLNHQMKIDIDDATSPDDVRMKNYNQTLTRFLNTKRKIPKELDIISPVKASEVTEDKPTRKSKDKSGVKRRRKTLVIPSPIGRAKRVRKTPKKFDWVNW